uniref:Uncharacterized protein n=1 Tax=Tanacetum cinerariifolium TaxID=118510 RepID=A0A6L2KA40_TANCI|nr:hypothetical protein [Tanacetum cinerariifolium]
MFQDFRYSDTVRPTRSDEMLKNFKKDAILKLFKLTNQEMYEHVGLKSHKYPRCYDKQPIPKTLKEKKPPGKKKQLDYSSFASPKGGRRGSRGGRAGSSGGRGGSSASRAGSHAERVGSSTGIGGSSGGRDRSTGARGKRGGRGSNGGKGASITYHRWRGKKSLMKNLYNKLYRKKRCIKGWNLKERGKWNSGNMKLDISQEWIGTETPSATPGHNAFRFKNMPQELMARNESPSVQGPDPLTQPTTSTPSNDLGNPYTKDRSNPIPSSMLNHNSTR